VILKLGGLGVELTITRHKNKFVTNVTKGLALGEIFLEKRPKPRKMNVR
jgi:hypothetical protein